MRKSRIISISLSLLIAVTVGILHTQTAQAATGNDQDVIALTRSTIKADRQAVVSDALQLSDKEATAFWPLYQQYRVEMDRIGDDLLMLIKKYAASHPDVSEELAKGMLSDLLSLEKRRTATRARFLKKFEKTLPAAKTLRFAQVESRLDLALQLRLAAEIPLVPVEGRITGDTTTTAVLAEGVPGGAVVQTHQLKATVIAIEKEARRLTLLSEAGIKQTIRVGDGAVNFDQIRVGDQLTVSIAERLIVYVAEEGEPVRDSAAQLVALAPKGAEPGTIMAETVQLTAQVTAIDLAQHRVALRFEDGTTRTTAVRRDVDLSKAKVGDRVVIRSTEALAIKVEK